VTKAAQVMRLGSRGLSPHVTEEHVVGKLHELRGEVPDHALRRSLVCHVDSLSQVSVLTLVRR
jgi:hypothetical protein